MHSEDFDTRSNDSLDKKEKQTHSAYLPPKLPKSVRLEQSKEAEEKANEATNWQNYIETRVSNQQQTPKMQSLTADPTFLKKRNTGKESSSS